MFFKGISHCKQIVIANKKQNYNYCMTKNQSSIDQNCFITAISFLISTFCFYNVILVLSHLLSSLKSSGFSLAWPMQGMYFAHPMHTVQCAQQFLCTRWSMGTDIFLLFITQTVIIFEISYYTQIFTDIFPFWKLSLISNLAEILTKSLQKHYREEIFHIWIHLEKTSNFVMFKYNLFLSNATIAAFFSNQ